MNAQVIHQPSLTINPDPRQPGSSGVGVYNLNPGLMLCVGKYLREGGSLRSVLRVKVVHEVEAIADNLPDICGRYQVLEDGVQFTPHFPFERGISYQASFDPRAFGCAEFSDVQTLEFSLPSAQSASPAEVKSIFPSSDYLPENLLRFYVCFASPMQRGRVEAEISLLGPDGEPVPDVLYRAPVELWDRSMRYLTILLDPGRLKRGVGPNRKLGPPLNAGQDYTLVVGSGMADLSGRPLGKAFQKRFRVTEAVRNRIAVDKWQIAPPVLGSRAPLVLMFPMPLDWALLSQTITIQSTEGQSVEGQFFIDQHERRWSFTPTSPWSAGCYNVCVASGLEDVCGNSAIAAFDRPLRLGSDLAFEVASSSISFELI